VELALDKAAALREQARWGEAQAVLEQARQGLSDSGPDDLRRQLGMAEAALALVSRLDAIRLRPATIVRDRFEAPTAARDYAAAFKEAGLGEVGDNEEAVARRVRASGVAGQLVAALDDWAAVDQEPRSMAWVLGVARRADPDPWRDRFRDPTIRGDRRALRALADEAMGGGEVRLRELSPQVLVALAAHLGGGGEAAPLLRAARGRYPSDFWVNLNLGHALIYADHAEEAVGYCRVAAALRPEVAAAHHYLGAALHARKHLDGAIAEFRQAIAIDPGYAKAHGYLGAVLQEKGDAEGAIAEFRRAIESDPEFPHAHCNLGHALRAQARFAEALAELRKGHELGSKRPDWPYPSADWVRQCERLAEFDRRLPAVLGGQADPADAAERLALAELCQQYKRLFNAAARLYAGAFAADPDVRRQHRWNAAGSAARAAAGHGIDGKHVPDRVRVLLRRQCLAWLRAELAQHERLAEANDPAAKQAVREWLRHWQQDADLAEVRDQQALDQLPEDEREAWRRLWQDVATLLAKVKERM
jgi:serine/threonine-protein kinase